MNLPKSRSVVHPSADELAEVLRTPSLPTIVVSLLSGRAIRGALAETSTDGIVLKRAAMADEDGAGHLKWKKADGEVFIPWAQVEYWQQGLDASLLE